MSNQLAEGVWHFDLGNVNAYLLDDGELTLIDAGTEGGASKIRQGMRDIGYEVGDIDRVLITHYDLDHVGGLSKLSRDLDAKIFIGEQDAPLLKGESKPSFTNLKGAFQRIGNLLMSLPELEIEVVEDMEKTGGFEAYHTPGHTRGHMVFVHSELETSLLGDLVREKDGSFEASPWFLSHDTSAVHESIKELVSRAPKFEIGCPGHGEPVTRNASEKLKNLANSLN